MPSLVPPSEEQIQIIEHIDAITERTGALIAKVREAIDKLRECRTALISAAVTGKIDVREEVA
jgi:type I restriction enzyme S subunit